MTDHLTARGLPSDWLNSWLAAIGVTALIPAVRLTWTDDAIPVAQFHGVPDLVDRLHAALPSVEALAASPIARKLEGHREMPRNFDLTVWEDRAQVERVSGHWHLAASATDLVDLEEGAALPHSPFDPPMPRGITLHDRVVACRDAVEDAEQVRASLNGAGRMVQTNGLGFDTRRLPTAVESAGKVFVDPVVELLAFYALPLFPARGAGRGNEVRARGWTDRPSQEGAFRWAAWRPLLGRWGVDAFLDRFYRGDGRHVLAMYESVPYRPSGTSDTTRAYASKRVA